MAFWNKTQPVRPLPNLNTHSTRSAAVILMDAVRAIPSQAACNAIYTALADKKDVSYADLEELSNRLGRLAWDKAEQNMMEEWARNPRSFDPVERRWLDAERKWSDHDNRIKSLEGKK